MELSKKALLLSYFTVGYNIIEYPLLAGFVGKSEQVGHPA